MAITLDGTNGILSPDFEPSSSTTPTNGLFLPAANTVGLATGSTERLRIDSSGNLGLGVTPSGWASSKAIEIGALGNAIVGFGAGDLELVSGAYYNGGYKYSATGTPALSYQIYNGAYLWKIAPSGTAGAAISFTQAMTLDASGRLGVGTSSPTSPFEVAKSASIDNAGAANKWVARLRDTTATAAGVGGGLLFQGIKAASGSVGNFAAIAGLKENATDNNENGYLAFFTTPNATGLLNERARIDSSGNLLVGKTASSQTSGEGVQLSPTTAAVNSYMAIVSPNSLTGTNIISAYSTGAANFRFYVQWDGKIYATSTSITAISDISLKENIRPLETGLAEVLALKPRRFDWKNGDGNNVAGFIAQEVETVLPDLVSDYKYNEEETKRGLKMGDMIPTLVKAIQELSAKVSALEAK